MSTIHIVENGQDIFDVCIQQYGTLDLLDQFLEENNLSINDFLIIGQELTINNENVGNLRVKNSYQNTNFVVMNADEDALATTVGAFNGDYNDDFGTDLLIS